MAALLGNRFGLICYEASAIPRHRVQIHGYGMENWIAGYRTVSMPIREIDGEPRQDGRNLCP